MKKKVKKKVKKTIDKVYNDEKYKEYSPKLYGEGKVVAYEISTVVGPDKKFTNYCMCSSWPNGEGFDFSFDDDNGVEKHISLHRDQIEIALACLNHFGEFD